jgi:hypothetical protein
MVKATPYDITYSFKNEEVILRYCGLCLEVVNGRGDNFQLTDDSSGSLVLLWAFTARGIANYFVIFRKL